MLGDALDQRSLERSLGAGQARPQCFESSIETAHYEFPAIGCEDCQGSVKRKRRSANMGRFELTA